MTFQNVSPKSCLCPSYSLAKPRGGFSILHPSPPAVPFPPRLSLCLDRDDLSPLEFTCHTSSRRLQHHSWGQASQAERASRGGTHAEARATGDGAHCSPLLLAWEQGHRLPSVLKGCGGQNNGPPKRPTPQSPEPMTCSFTWQKGLCRSDEVKALQRRRLSGIIQARPKRNHPSPGP